MPVIQKVKKNILRPLQFKDFVGQQKIIDNFQVFIQAAKKREESLDHVLLSGPPGLGKTTLAYIITYELNSQIEITSGPALDKPSDLAGLLTKLTPKGILFIDEIHRLNPIVEEYLYTAMEDFKLDIMLDTGANAKSIQLNLHPFTLIGATTRAGLLTSPFRARFSINAYLAYYEVDKLVQIVKRSSKLLNMDIEEEAAYEIARRSRGTPRIANNLLRRVRDFVQVYNHTTIQVEVTKNALKALNVDKNGLNEIDIRILRTIIEKFNGGPVGINTIATACNEEAHTIEEVHEPFLLQEGYMKRTVRGREITPKAYKHLGKDKAHPLEKAIKNQTLNLY